MNRLEATKRLVIRLTDEIVVGNVGNASRDLWAAGHRPQNYYSQGAMGMPSSIGLGLALAQPARTVIVLDGDGSLLMNLGSLATIGVLRPPHLIHIVWDNAQYQLTGGQLSHTGLGVNLAVMARGAGIPKVAETDDLERFDSLVAEALSTAGGPWFILARVTPVPSQASIPVDPILLKHDFMRGIGTLQS